MNAAVIRTGLCVALIAVAACQSGTAPGWETALAQTRWDERRPAAYQYTVHRSCECLPEMSGPVRVSVEGSTVTRRYIATNAVVPSTHTELFPTIDGLFEIIEAAQRQNVVRLDVDYDPAYGFPTRVFIDVDRWMADDEITYTVTDFAIPVR